MGTDHTRTAYSASEHAIHIYWSWSKNITAPWNIIDRTFQKRLWTHVSFGLWEEKSWCMENLAVSIIIRDPQFYTIFNHHAQIAWTYSMGKYQKIMKVSKICQPASGSLWESQRNPIKSSSSNTVPMKSEKYFASVLQFHVFLKATSSVEIRTFYEE